LREGRHLSLPQPAWLLLHEDVGENYDAVARSAAAAVGAESCDLALYDDVTRELIARRPHYAAPSQAVPQFRFPVSQAPASARVVLTGEPYVSNNPAMDPLYESSVRDRGLRSVLTVPVRHNGRILGLLYALNKPGGFQRDDMATLSALAGAAAVTLENIRLYAEERERRVLNESLREVSRALVGTASEDLALGTVLDQMWRVVRYQAASALVLEGETLRVAASRGGDADASVPLAETGELAQALHAREPAVIKDTPHVLPALGLRGLTGPALAVPLLGKERPRGALLVVFEGRHRPGSRDGQLVGAFADHAALFLEAGALLRRERQGRARATAVARVTRLAASRHEPDALLQGVVPELLSVSGADRAVLYLRSPRSETLAPVATAGVTAEEEPRVAELRLDLGSRQMEDLRRGAAMAFQEPGLPAPAGTHTFPQAKSVLFLALASRDQVLGAAVLVSLRRSRHFDPGLVEYLKDLAQQVALGVENARLFSALSQMASTDELTQLANRRRFGEALRSELARARRLDSPLSLVLADVDHLKAINDAFGHPAGDAAIRHVAEMLREGRREIDLPARLGGEEFGLLLPGSEPSGAFRAAERVRHRLTSTQVPSVGTVTVSMGVASFPEDGQSEEQLIRVADQRLYAAKEGGRNRVCAYSLDLPLQGPRAAVSEA
jgi:diguanylate cyclase (GGDEF)-like protein